MLKKGVLKADRKIRGGGGGGKVKKERKEKMNRCEISTFKYIDKVKGI